MLLRYFHSRIPTSMIPLSEFRKVTLLLDASAPDAEKAEDCALSFLGRAGVEPDVVPVGRRGLIRVSRNTQVLISLIPEYDWRSRYVVRRSQAVFKIGRCQLDGHLFDLVVSDPAGRHYPQSEVLEKIFEILLNLK